MDKRDLEIKDYFICCFINSIIMLGIRVYSEQPINLLMFIFITFIGPFGCFLFLIWFLVSILVWLSGVHI